MNTRDQVRQLIASLLRDRGDSHPFGDSDVLVSSGRLESLAVMEIAAHLEAKYGMDFGRIGFEPSDFESVASIAGLVDRELRARPQPAMRS